MPIGFLDSPAANQPVKGKIQATGWAYSKDGIDNVSIYVDGHYIANTEANLPRPDVLTNVPGTAGNTGWTVAVDLSQANPGPHQLLAQAHSHNGASRDVGSINVLVQK